MSSVFVHAPRKSASSTSARPEVFRSMPKTASVNGTQRAPFGLLARKSAGTKQQYRRRLHAQVDSGGGVSGKRYTVPGGWGGTDRLGALYEWRVIRPEPCSTNAL